MQEIIKTKDIYEIFGGVGVRKCTLSNGWNTSHFFTWSICDKEGAVEIRTASPEVEVCGAELIDEYSDTEIKALENCEVCEVDAIDEVINSQYYSEALEEYRDSLDPYSYYGVSETMFF